MKNDDCTHTQHANTIFELLLLLLLLHAPPRADARQDRIRRFFRIAIHCPVTRTWLCELM